MQLPAMEVKGMYKVHPNYYHHPSKKTATAAANMR
uniref:Uncharacterized protein n=1 Tax=Anopheles quadriannulatus TaxID=34691 RepID=A0A182XQ84_ANOQN